MHRLWLIVLLLFLSASAEGAIYYMRADGSAANKGAATSCSAAATAMSIVTHNAETFAAGDTITLCDTGGDFHAALTPPTSGGVGTTITYTKSGTPKITGLTAVTGFTENDIPALVSDLGGDSIVAGIYDARTGVTVTSGVLVDSWADARGSSGFGPSLAGVTTTRPDYDSTNKVITFVSGEQLISSANALFNGSTPFTMVWIGAVTSSANWNGQMSIINAGETEWAIIRYWSDYTAGHLFDVQFPGGTHPTLSSTIRPADNVVRIITATINTDLVHIYLPVLGEDKSSSVFDKTLTSANMIMRVGNTAGCSPMKVGAVMFIRGVLTTEQMRVLQNWAANKHAAVTSVTPEPSPTAWQKAGVTTEPKVVIKDGVPLVRGSATDSLTENQWYWAGNVLTIRKYPSLSGTIEAGDTNALIVAGTKTNLTVDGLWLRGCNTSCITGSGDNVTVQKSKIEYGTTGGVALSGANAKAEYNILLYNNGTALSLSGAGGISYNNTFFLNPGDSEKITTTGYKSKNNIKYLSDLQKYAENVDSGVGDTPDIDYNLYIRPLNIPLGLHTDFIDADPSDVVTRINNVASLGATIQRTTMGWDAIEATQGVYDWSKPDAILSHCEAHGIETLAVVARSPQWANGNADTFIVPGTGVDNTFTAWKNNYVTFITALANRYKGRIHKWEIWNEWNLDLFWKPSPDVTQYGAFYNAIYAALKAVDSTNQVAVGGLSATQYEDWSGGGAQMVQTLFTQGQTIDHVGWHTYSSQAPDNNVFESYWKTTPPEYRFNFGDVNKLIRVLQKNSSTADIWFTEWGWLAYPDNTSLVQRAAWIPLAMNEIRGKYADYVKMAILFMDKQLVGQTDNTGVFDASDAATVQAEPWKQNALPLFNWKGTDYATTDWLTNSGVDANSKWVDPFFVSTVTPDFHLQAASPAINAGVDVGLTTDYAGRAVPNGAGVDIGAMEYYGGLNRIPNFLNFPSFPSW